MKFQLVNPDGYFGTTFEVTYIRYSGWEMTMNTGGIKRTIGGHMIFERALFYMEIYAPLSEWILS